MASLIRTAPPRTVGVIAPGQSFASIGDDIGAVAFNASIGRRWWIAFAFALALIGVLLAALTWLFIEGIGIWGNNVPVTWALDIVGYDWWIGVASGGLLVSALFLLLGAEWRCALNRITETLSLVAAAAAAVYPIIHLGRPWLFYWNLPYPNTLLLWPQFRSPLFWDAVDILSFLTVGLVFWYIGLIPDLATLRDTAVEQAAAGRLGDQRTEAGRRRGLLRAQLYGIAALGWRGSAIHWVRWSQAYRIVAMLGVIVVISLQTGAAVMFAGSVEPGWHDPLMPVAFLIAAVFGGTAFIAGASVLLRSIFDLGGLITPRHLDVLAWLLLGLGLLDLYCEAASAAAILINGDSFEIAVMHERVMGPHAWAFWTVALAALLPVHAFWFAGMRRSPGALLAIGLLVAVGLFADHFMIIVVTLQHDFLPAAVQAYTVDVWGVATFVGSIGLFLALMLLALRSLPLVSIVETRRLARIVAGRPR